MVLTKCMLYCCILPALILEFATEPIFIFVVLTYQFSTTIVSGAQYYWVKLCGWFLWKVRRHINLRIEAQRRYLEKMTEEHRYLSTVIGKPHRPSKSLPSLCKESESDTRECTSDSEAVGTGYLNSTSEFPELSRGYSSQKDTSSEEIQAQKRPRAVDKFFQGLNFHWMVWNLVILEISSCWVLIVKLFFFFFFSLTVTVNGQSPVLSSFCF